MILRNGLELSPEVPFALTFFDLFGMPSASSYSPNREEYYTANNAYGIEQLKEIHLTPPAAKSIVTSPALLSSFSSNLSLPSSVFSYRDPSISGHKEHFVTSSTSPSPNKVKAPSFVYAMAIAARAQFCLFKVYVTAVWHRVSSILRAFLRCQLQWLRYTWALVYPVTTERGEAELCGTIMKPYRLFPPSPFLLPVVPYYCRQVTK